MHLYVEWTKAVWPWSRTTPGFDLLGQRFFRLRRAGRGDWATKLPHGGLGRRHGTTASSKLHERDQIDWLYSWPSGD
jgi:hypothetical protein